MREKKKQLNCNGYTYAHCTRNGFLSDWLLALACCLPPLETRSNDGHEDAPSVFSASVSKTRLTCTPFHSILVFVGAEDIVAVGGPTSWHPMWLPGSAVEAFPRPPTTARDRAFCRYPSLLHRIGLILGSSPGQPYGGRAESGRVPSEIVSSGDLSHTTWSVNPARPASGVIVTWSIHILGLCCHNVNFEYFSLTVALMPLLKPKFSWITAPLRKITKKKKRIRPHYHYRR